MQGNHNSHVGTLPATPAELTEDLLRRHRAVTPRFRIAVVILGALFILGIVGFALRVADGFDDRVSWGYYAALFAFLLTTAQSAPIVSIATLMTTAHWRRPVSRAAELFAVVGLYNLLLFIPLLAVLPSLADGRRSIWFDAPRFSPHVWATLALVFLVVCGMALLYAAALPDMATVRDHSSGRRQRFFSRLALGWQGTNRQWFTLRRRIGALAALYFMLLILVHTLISVDFAMSLVPGWKDAIFPAYHALSALQASVGTLLVTLFVLRQFGGYKDYITLDQFWALGKLLLALSLLWFYFWWSGFIVFWYGRQPIEQNVLQLIMFGPYRSVFIATFVLNFLVPLFCLIWNPVRKSVWGPTIIGASVVIGAFFDRIRLYVAAYSVGDVDGRELEVVPAAHLPDAADVLFIIGALAGAILVYLLATRIFPAVNIWEMREYLLLRMHRPFGRREVRVLAKPE